MFNYYEHVRLHYVYKSKNSNHKHDVPFFQTIRYSVQTRCPDQWWAEIGDPTENREYKVQLV